jgi:Protein of unknown function (DUF3800)
MLICLHLVPQGNIIMRLLFLDESGDALMGGPFKILVLAGVIVRADQWTHLNLSLEALKKDRGLAPALEIKWRHVRHPGGRKNPLNAFNNADRVQYGKDMLSIVRSSVSSRVLGVVIDKVTAYTRSEITTPGDVYERAVMFMMERFQYYLKATEDYGVVVQDQRQEKQDLRLRAFYRSLLVGGTRWTRFPNIIESVFLTPSHFSTGIQFADFVAGSIYAAHVPDHLDHKFFNIIQGKITGNKQTGVRHGFKKWP